MKQLREISFRFWEKSSPSSYASGLSRDMQNQYPGEWILSEYLIREYNPQLINEMLGLLRHDNFILKLASHTFTELDQRERWYETEYKIEPLSDKLIQVNYYFFFFFFFYNNYL